jgi:hypothetical protein
MSAARLLPLPQLLNHSAPRRLNQQSMLAPIPRRATASRPQTDIPRTRPKPPQSIPSARHYCPCRQCESELLNYFMSYSHGLISSVPETTLAQLPNNARHLQNNSETTWTKCTMQNRRNGGVVLFHFRKLIL